MWKHKFLRRLVPSNHEGTAPHKTAGIILNIRHQFIALNRSMLLIISLSSVMKKFQQSTLIPTTNHSLFGRYRATVAKINIIHRRSNHIFERS